MAYLTKTQLNAQLAGNGNLDATVRNALIQSLVADLIYSAVEDGKLAEVDSSQGGPIPVNVLDLGGSLNIVATNPDLKAIAIDTSAPSTLYLTGAGGASNSNPLFVGLGNGGDTVQLFATQYVDVLGGSGADVLGGGQ